MCLHAKHVFSNQFGWYLSFNCIITEKCMFFYNDPSTFAWHDFVSLDYTADVKDNSQPSENRIWNTIFIYLVGNELVLGSYFINLENVFISAILLPLILIGRVWRKGVIRSRKSKDRQDNGQMKKDKHWSTKHYTKKLQTENRRRTQVLHKDKQFLVLIWYLSCCSCYIPSDPFPYSLPRGLCGS